MHHRLRPKEHLFFYNVFMFYIDLDEVDLLAKKFFLISRNRFNVFSFRDKDHLQMPYENPDRTKPLKEHIKEYLQQYGVKLTNEKIFLLTNLCTLGYQFNPVSFYFISPFFFKEQRSGTISCVVEVSNTFHEMKPFFIGEENFDGRKFHMNTVKYFYVSPFIEMDARFDFSIEIPAEKLNIKIDTVSKIGKKIITTTLTGTQKKLTNTRLIWYAIRFPFITLQVIGLIHWNAFKLWLKKIPYHKKNSHIDLQRGIYKR